jgi:hypothetical protein
VIVGFVVFSFGWIPLRSLGGAFAFCALWVVYLIAEAGSGFARRRSELRHARIVQCLCPGCGYDLRASADRCPECGRRILPSEIEVRYAAHLSKEAHLLLHREQLAHGRCHTYTPVDLADIPAIDRAFHDAKQSELVVLGFRLLGEIEDRTIRRHFAPARVAFRVFTGPGGNEGEFTIASVGHLPHADDRFVRLQTELSDGSFVVTEGTSHAIDHHRMQIPGIQYGCVPGSIAAALLLTLHRRIVEERCRPTGATAIELRDMAAAIDSQNDLERLSVNFRRRMGFIDEQEMRLRLGRELTPFERDLVRELQRQQQAL